METTTPNSIRGLSPLPGGLHDWLFESETDVGLPWESLSDVENGIGSDPGDLDALFADESQRSELDENPNSA